MPSAGLTHDGLLLCDIHHAKTTSITIMLHPPVHCFHGSPPESTHDAQRYVRHCLCSNNSCNKCPLRRNSHSQSGLLLFKAFFHKSQTLNEYQFVKKNSLQNFFYVSTHQIFILFSTIQKCVHDQVALIQS